MATHVTKEPVTLDGYQAILKPSEYGYTLTALLPKDMIDVLEDEREAVGKEGGVEILDFNGQLRFQFDISFRTHAGLGLAKDIESQPDAGELAGSLIPYRCDEIIRSTP